MATGGELVEFYGDDTAANAPDYAAPWKILIVDDDQDVHRSTELALRASRILERPLAFLHAATSHEAVALLREHPDVAVILLDVVMEREDAGLAMVRVVREVLGLAEVRIILRTGQPGYAPEIETICHYDINDYKTKSELTRTKLLTAMIAAVRSFDQLSRLQHSRRGLKQIVNACNDFISLQGITEFSEGVLTQLAALMGIAPAGLVCASANRAQPGNGLVIAAAGRCAGFLNRPLSEIDDPQLVASLRRSFDTGARQIGPRHLTLHFSGRQGRSFAVYLESAAPLRHVDEQLLEVFCSNIAICCENVELVAELREHAFTDRLLRLPNRLALIHRIDTLRSAGQQAGKAVALLDVDQFSEANDMFGHAYGDALLQAISARLVDGLGAHCVVARVAGDVFGVLGDEAQVRPEVLRQLFAQPFAPAGTDHMVSASIGLVRLTGYGGSGADLLKDASIAIKRAKAAGQGQVVYFTDTIAHETRHRTRLLADLRHAFQFERLYMAFQPQVELASGRIVGVEALMRWPTSEESLVSPEVFIPVAEQSGLIVNLGEWGLRAALQMLQQVQAQGLPPLRMAVNVSPVQFRHPAFLEVLDRALRDHATPAQALELEITESVAMTGSSAIERALHEVKARAVAVAIDDFGTGYSSLSYLDRLPVDRIKIDKAFIRPLGAPQPDTRIVEMVIALSHKLGLKVIAEGVETQAQAELLRGLGCDEAQGYLWGKPMTGEALLRLLAER
ncbi:EAL domain-containing response regulator [Ideonella sp. BN130291]|uniref:EAL domain-containing response regulator n=1 Tax=Ideonella sp. BN130291 TaxID=3112940 RepID=UPI002E2639EF|nr:EAL domain-containing protein [Ideonella sp. BN130291]